MRGRLAVAVVIVLTLASSARSAHAESDADRSRAHFNKGVELAHAGHDKEARDEFVAAYKLYPHDSILLNLGITRAKTGEYVDAEADLMRYLSDYAAATPEEQTSARATLADVRGHLGTVRVRVLPAGARLKIDERAIALLPGEWNEVRVVNGKRTISAEAENFLGKSESVNVTTNHVETIELRLAPVTAGERAARNFELPAAGMVLIGVALTALGIGTYSAIHALDLSQRYDSSHDPSLRSEGLTFRTLTDVCFGIAIVSGASGAYLTFTKSAQTTVAISPSGAIVHF